MEAFFGNGGKKITIVENLEILASSRYPCGVQTNQTRRGKIGKGDRSSNRKQRETSVRGERSWFYQRLKHWPLSEKEICRRLSGRKGKTVRIAAAIRDAVVLSRREARIISSRYRCPCLGGGDLVALSTIRYAATHRHLGSPAALFPGCSGDFSEFHSPRPITLGNKLMYRGPGAGDIVLPAAAPWGC